MRNISYPHTSDTSLVDLIVPYCPRYDDAQNLLRLLSDFFSTLYTGPNDKKTLKEKAQQYCDNLKLNSRSSEAIISIVTRFFNNLSIETVHPQLNLMRKQLDSLPILTIAVPTQLTEDEIVSLGSWARTILSPHLLLRIYIDEGTIGGARIGWDSKEHTITLPYYFNKYQNSVKQLITTIST